MATIGSGQMDQVTEEQVKKDRDLHHHALRGDVVEVGGMDIAHNIEENNPNSEKAKAKKEEQERVLHIVLEAQEAYNALMERLNAELEFLQNTIRDLEKQMNDNRLIWEHSVTILDEIDDVFCDFEDGGELDRSKAQEIICEAGFEIPENASDADMIALLQNIRIQRLEAVEKLDADYLIMEADHKRFKEREGQVITAKQKLEDIGNDQSLNHDQRLQAIKNLGQEVGSKTMHTTASKVQDQELASQADDFVKEDIINNKSDMVVKPISIPGMG